MLEITTNQKVAYIISDLNYSVAFEWIAEDSKHRSYTIDFIFLNQHRPKLMAHLEKNGFNCYLIPLETGYLNHLKSFKFLFELLKKGKYQLVHCHLLKGNLLGLSAAYLLGIKSRIYTRHHSTFHHENSLKGIWLDKLINKLASGIIAISKNVESILINQEGVPSRKVHLIEHGFKLNEFKEVDQVRVDKLRNQYQLSAAKFHIGVIARFIEWKGHEYIIDAFARLIKEDAGVHLVLANASGPDQDHIERKLSKLPEGSYTLIEFEKDLFALYHCFDLFVHVPVNPKIEAFGQTYIEALAAKIPSIFTLSGIAHQFIKDQHNALVVPHCDSEAIYQAMKQLKGSEGLRLSLSANGIKDIQQFSLEKMCNSLNDLYASDQ